MKPQIQKVTQETSCVTYAEIEAQFLTWQRAAGSVPFASCFGKTMADRESMRVAEEIGSLLLAQGYGVLHGGYTGMMQAVSEGANRLIRAHAEDPAYAFRNIGVPFERFDPVCGRAECLQLPSASSIWDRRRAITELGEIAVVLPLVGIGTFAEAWDVLHENYLSEDDTAKQRPLVFYGAAWKSVLKQIRSTFHISFSQNLQETLFFPSTNMELEYVLGLLRQSSFLRMKKSHR